MTPVIAIVGRPNVGKSTLFNQLTRSREALVIDVPGVTRDRQYGEGKLGEKPFIVIDTGGIGDEQEAVDGLMAEQSWAAVDEADAVFFLVDGRSGRIPLDETIASKLRHHQKPVFLVVNKTDGLDASIAIADFFALGLNNPIAIAASHGRGISQLMEIALEAFETEHEHNSEEDQNLNSDQGIKIAIAGRPNVGKSTLTNRMLGEERVIVFDEPGTTRDSIYIPLERRNQKYTIIDTAGVRRRSRISETVEKFSVVKTLQAIEDSHVVILVMDAQKGITDQDLSLLGFVIETGKALVLAVNKWDDLSLELKENFKRALYRLEFANFAKVHYISALHGTGVGNLFDSVQKAYKAATKTLSTPIVTRALEKAVKDHPPPMVRGRRIKLRYAHTGGHNPPIIVIHGNQTEEVPESYKRYLMNTFRKLLRLEGTPLRLEFKSSHNPFADRRNTLTPRQEYKRKRLKDFVKKRSR